MKAPKQGEKKLSLGELEALTGFFVAVFFALFLARIASQIAEFFQRRADLFVILDESAGDAQARGNGLRFDAATLHADDEIVLLWLIELLERSHDLFPLQRERKVLLEGAAVDVHNASAFAEANGGNCGFSAADADGFIGDHENSLVHRDGVLGLHAVLSAFENAELLHLLSAEASLRHHAVDGMA